MSVLRIGVLAGFLVVSAFAQENPDTVYQAAVDLLSEGRQKDAEARVEKACVTYPDDQRLLFLRGVLERSRFHRDDAFKTFSKVYALGADSLQGRAALASTSMDFDMGIEEGLGALRSLIESHPDEILLRWLFAIQCRTHRKYPEEAEEQYLIILNEWNPGPVMVNHTYANILTESLDRPEEALVYRERALEQVQRGWTYQGYANTLRELGRYEEASDAFKTAVEISPRSIAYWRQWGDCLIESGQVAKAYKVYRAAYESGLRDAKILTGLGRANELGRGTTQNDIQALGWYERAALKGSGEAMYRLGRMREEGRGDSKDYVVAAEWYRKAMDMNYDRPRPDLARLYMRGGYGLDRDLQKVEDLYGGFSRDLSPSDNTATPSTFLGLWFVRSRASDRWFWVLDYDGTCRALGGRIFQGDDSENDLLAWLYAIYPDPSPNIRGAAVNLAEGLCRKDEKNPQWRNTLAAAYARDGRFDRAVTQQRRAIKLLSSKRKDSEEGRAYMERLKLYQSEWPYTAYCGEKFASPPESKSPAKILGDTFRKAGEFERGKGCEKDYGKALELYQKAAEEGDPAAWQISKIYQRGGFGVDRNLDRAAESYAKWASARSIPENAQYVGVHKLILSFADTAGEEKEVRVEYGITISTCKEAVKQGNQESTDLLAWIYATCKTPRYRNGGEAVRLAERLCLKDENNPQWRNTLAAAYARAGKYSKAVEQQQQAIALLSERRKSSQEGIAYSSRLELYRKKKPFPPDE